MNLRRSLLFACAVIAPCLGGVATLRSAENPRVFAVSPQALIETRARLARGDTTLQPALDQLRKDADAALRIKPPSVLDKPSVAASGDKRDYFSYGPYWWPDPTKPDGLPYIRRDGDLNPASKKGTDDAAFDLVVDSLQTLGLAYFFTGHEPYAIHAARIARVWFLDPSTGMKPNLDHAQAIPGITKGRGIGIIESRDLGRVADALALLGKSAAWTDADRAAFTAWTGNYLHWLRTSPNGTDEQDELNNHGTWYDVQAAHLCLVLGEKSEARKILTQGLTLRLAAQIEPDGRQPRELLRTKSLDYSLFNLEALFLCAQLGGEAGVDWWGYQTADGRSLRAALAYLAPYADPAKAWPKKDLVEADRARLLPLFAQYLAHRDDPTIRELHEKFSATTEPAARWRLLWPVAREEAPVVTH
ncbi:MAG TPA: alginate lyase family protein [Opitutaceae bacterium]|nr:alginate lyase family protein [Opitutaceae bacterium]